MRIESPRSNVGHDQDLAGLAAGPAGHAAAENHERGLDMKTAPLPPTSLPNRVDGPPMEHTLLLDGHCLAFATDSPHQLSSCPVLSKLCERDSFVPRGECGRVVDISIQGHRDLVNPIR